MHTIRIFIRKSASAKLHSGLKSLPFAYNAPLKAIYILPKQALCGFLRKLGLA